eukprot:s2507_g1.t1
MAMPGPPLKQYELTLQNAQRVLISLLEQPAKPWVPFDALLRELGQQVALLQRRSAACLLQRRQRARRAEGGCRGSDLRKVPTRNAGGYADSPKKVLIPVPPPIQAPGGPLNPLEKRRHMVAAQLAISHLKKDMVSVEVVEQGSRTLIQGVVYQTVPQSGVTVSADHLRSHLPNIKPLPGTQE